MTEAPRKPGNYDIGYSKPPIATRFEKGKSGNPGGRPKRQKVQDVTQEATKALLLEEAFRALKIKDGDKVVTMPALQALIRSTVNGGIKGNHRQQRTFLQALMKIEEEKLADWKSRADVFIEHKLIVEEEREKAMALGRQPPEFFPNPDHFALDETGQLIVRGPLFASEKEHYEKLFKLRAELEEETRWIERELEANGTNPLLKRQHARVCKWIKKLNRRVGP